MTNHSQFFRIMPLFIVIFIDMLGGSLLIPLLPHIFIDKSTSILPVDTSSSMRYFLFGLTQGISSLAMFLGAPIFGNLSDRIGRKKILLICLFGNFVGYLFGVFSLLTNAVSLLLMGRVIAGFTAGSISTAQAAVVDISTSEENRATNIGYVILALSLGSILGPLISGTLSNSRWVSWFQTSTPFYFEAFLAFFNIIYLYFSFKETFTPTTTKSIKLFEGLSVFASAFKMPSIRGLSIAFLLMQLGWATYIQFIALFLTLRYHLTGNEIGVFMACIGVGFTLAFCYLLKFFTHRFPLRKIALVSIGLISASLLLIIGINSQLSAWILSVPAATCLALGYSVLITLFSETVGKDKQGWIMGLTGAITAFSFGITGITAGVLANFGAETPIWLALGFLLLSTVSVYLISQQATCTPSKKPC